MAQKDKELTWIKTSLGYELALDGNQLMCKNAKGKPIKSIPKKVKELPEAQQIMEFSTWCGKHQEQTQQQIQNWMQRQLAIPAIAIEQLWQDDVWKNSLENIVIAPIQKNKVILEECGFLKGISKKGVGVVNIDGETCWLKTDAVIIPHPVLLPDLAELRELATDINIKQNILQIFREIWILPQDQDKDVREIYSYSGGYFEALMHASGRCKKLGYKVSGGYATCPIWEQGEMIEARFWIGSDYPESETYTGELFWINEKGQGLKLKDVGTVAFSEGHRMASAIFAGRSKKDDENVELPAPVKENPQPPEKLTTLSEKQLLDAGGMIAFKGKVPPKYNCDNAQVRLYENPANPKAKYTILTTKKLSPGDDNLMSYYGFKKVAVVENVGKKINRALGFPAWPLIHDAKNAKYALDILKDFQKCAKQAKSKPGHARTAFNDIGVKLGKTTPHFLPSFYEEVGRVFIQVGNVQYASQSFNKAREAEKVHALKVDEKMRREVFLEFALSGSLSIQIIKEYAKELENLYKPDTAYAYFTDLCAKRIKGGMAPFKDMGKLITTLADKCKKDSDKLKQEFLLDIFDAPTLGKAPLDFWKHYTKTIKDICAKNGEYRAKILFLFPMKYQKLETISFWLKLLWNNGILELLKDKKLCKKYEVSPSKWLQKATYYCIQSYGRTVEIPTIHYKIVRQYASEFKREKLPLSLEESFGGGGRSYYNSTTSVNADLLDLLLELKIEVGSPTDSTVVQFSTWYQPLEKNEERQRELSFVCHDKRYAPLLKESMGDYLAGLEISEHTKAEAFVIKNPLLKKLYREYLLEKCQECLDGFMRDLTWGVNALLKSLTPKTLEIFPELQKELDKINPVKNLTRNLQEGVFAELGHIPLDQYLQSVSAKERKQLIFSGFFPYLTVASGGKVTVLGPESEVGKFDITIAKGYKYQSSYYTDGDLLVILEKDYYNKIAYWSSAPKNKFVMDKYIYDTFFNLAGISSFSQTQLLADFLPKHCFEGKSSAFNRLLFCDGKHYWTVEWIAQENSNQVLEWDPKANKAGRKSLPAFFQTNLKDDEEILFRKCQLYPLPKEIKNSPLGLKKGLTGLLVKKTKSQEFYIETTDGKNWQGKLSYVAPKMLIDWPAKKEKLLLVVNDRYYYNTSMEAVDKNGKVIFSAEISSDEDDEDTDNTILPTNWWHLFSPRDLKCSQALRKLNEKTVKKAFVSFKKQYKEKMKLEELGKIISKEISIVKNPLIAMGIAEFFITATNLKIRLDEFLNPSEKKAVSKKINPGNLASAMKKMISITDSSYYYGSQDQNIYPQLEQLDQWLTKTKKSDSVDNKTETDWLLLPASVGTMAFICLSNCLEEAEREAILSFMEWLALSPLLKFKDQIKVYKCIFNCKESDEKKYNSKLFIKSQSGTTHIIRYIKRWHEPMQATVLEISKAKKATLPANHSDIQEEISVEDWWLDKKRLTQFVKHCREAKPVEITQAHIDVFCEQTGVSSATAVRVLHGLLFSHNYYIRDTITDLRKKYKIKKTHMDNSNNEIPNFSLTMLNFLTFKAMRAYVKVLDKPATATEDFVALLIEHWNEIVGKRKPIDVKFLEKAKKQISHRYNYHDFFLHLNGSAPMANYSTDGKWKLRTEYGAGDFFYSEPEQCFGFVDFKVFIELTLWIHDHTAVADDVRAGIPSLCKQITKRLANPNLIFASYDGTLKYHTNNPKEINADLEYLESVLGKSQTKKGKKRSNKTTEHFWNTDAISVAFVYQEHSSDLYVGFTPKKLKNQETLKKVLKLLDPTQHYYYTGSLEHWELYNSKGFQSMLKRIEKTPLKEGEWENNPLHSAPEVVAQVQKKYKLSQEGAMLYLQTLALAEPTKENITKWNGWKNPVYKTAATELTKKKLLLEAKRKRAGRDHFLPGGWLDLKAPDLPIEIWKLPLYGLCLNKENVVEKLLMRILPLKPLHEMFEDAWLRIKKGDVPKLEEVK